MESPCNITPEVIHRLPSPKNESAITNQSKTEDEVKYADEAKRKDNIDEEHPVEDLHTDGNDTSTDEVRPTKLEALATYHSEPRYVCF